MREVPNKPCSSSCCKDVFQNAPSGTVDGLSRGYEVLEFVGMDDGKE